MDRKKRRKNHINAQQQSMVYKQPTSYHLLATKQEPHQKA